MPFSSGTHNTHATKVALNETTRHLRPAPCFNTSCFSVIAPPAIGKKCNNAFLVPLKNSPNSRCRTLRTDSIQTNGEIDFARVMPHISVSTVCVTSRIDREIGNEAVIKKNNNKKTSAFFLQGKYVKYY